MFDKAPKDLHYSEVLNRKKKELPRVNTLSLENEFKVTPKVLIQLRTTPLVIEYEDSFKNKRTADVTEAINASFLLLSETRQLEADTPRVKQLQSYVDTMVSGNSSWEDKVRVVIINKGLEPEAFVYPDGTIFISQSLLNMYDTLDEIVAILAHEVNHLLKNTVAAKYAAEINSHSSLGVSWVHEITSDSYAPALLEKTNFKSTALVSAIATFAKDENRRGSAHQSPLMRSMQQLGVHTIKDYETSHIDYTPLPSEYKVEAKPTNLDLIIEILSDNDLKLFEQNISKLHPKDLKAIFLILNNNAYFRFPEHEPSRETLRSAALITGQLIASRALELGLTDEQIKLFFLSITKRNSILAPQFKNITELTTYIPLAKSMDDSKTIDSIHQQLFNTSLPVYAIYYLTDYAHYNLDRLGYEDEVVYPETISDFVSKIFQYLQTKPEFTKSVFKTEDDSYVQRDGMLTDAYHNTLFLISNYINDFYLKEVPDGHLDPEQIEDVFTEFKNNGYEFIGKFTIASFNTEINNIRIIDQAFKKIYNQELFYSYEDDTHTVTRGEFEQQIKSRALPEIALLFKKDHIAQLEKSTYLEYVQLAFDHIRDADISSEVLLKLLFNLDFKTGQQWEETADGNLLNQHTQEVYTPEQFAQTYRLSEQLQAEISKQKTALLLSFVSKVLAKYPDEAIAYIQASTDFTKLDVQSLEFYELLKISSPIFKLSEEKTFLLDDYDTFYNLELVQALIEKQPSCNAANILDLQNDIRKQHILMNNSLTSMQFKLFEDNNASILFTRNLRNKFEELTLPENLTFNDYPTLIEILDEYVPYSSRRFELKKKLLSHYIFSQNVEITEKIDFFFKNYTNLGIDVGLQLAEQINDQKTFELFKTKLDAVETSYVSGEKDTNLFAISDIASTMINRNPKLIIESVLNDKKEQIKKTTELAHLWIESFLFRENESINPTISYIKKSKKFALSGSGITTFTSFKDIIDVLKSSSLDKRLALMIKSLTDQHGLLTNDEGRSTLSNLLLNGLKLKQEFLKKLFDTAVKKGDANIIGLPAAQMLAPLLFNAFNIEAIDYNNIGKETHSQRDESNTIKQKKLNKYSFFEDLRYIFSSTTRTLRLFGHKYAGKLNTEMTQLAQESNDTYDQILANISQQFKNEEINSNRTETHIDKSVEGMIKAGETSALLVRGMQMAVQLIDFPSQIRDRLADTQDNMKGMEKFRFWENLLAKAEIDPELQNFIDNKLITLDDYLGGGSLFTTYGATIKGENGDTKKVVIKMLNPNAEEFVRLTHDLCSSVLDEMEHQASGEILHFTHLTRSLTDLSYIWCIKDINDPNSQQLDDDFRKIIQSYNSLIGSSVLEAPERIYSSKKVKIEDQYTGKTLNKMLKQPDIHKKRKQELIKHLIGFFDHQFNFSPTKNILGENTYIFHSDPHAGNYMVDSEQIDLNLGVIDRSMYITLSETEVSLFRLLKDNKSITFVNQFILRCLEINNITNPDALRIRASIWNQLGGEALRQGLGKPKDATAYLQIILQTFAKYGERYAGTKNISASNVLEQSITNYFNNNQYDDSLHAYNKLKKDKLFLKEDNDISYKEFKKILSTMTKNNMLTKKSIEVPLEYRLMIRNIVAMNNLKQQWLM